MNEKIGIAYFGGVKVGIESLVEELKKIAEKDEKLLTIDVIEMIASDSILHVESKLKEFEYGNDAIEVLNELKG